MMEWFWKNKMGERYQIHTRFEYKDWHGKKIVDKYSIHLQWCWGRHIIRNIGRLLNRLDNSKLDHPSHQELGAYISSILRVNQGMDGKYYPYSIILEEEAYNTTEGDSNHGWAVIFVSIDDDGNVKLKSKFYNDDGEEVSNEELLKNSMDEEDKTSLEETMVYKKLKEILDEEKFNNTDEDLQAIWNEEINQEKDEKQ